MLRECVLTLATGWVALLALVFLIEGVRDTIKDVRAKPPGQRRKELLSALALWVFLLLVVTGLGRGLRVWLS